MEGTGYFKFALCNSDCSATYWSNDNSSENGSEPTESIPIDIEFGIFNLMLGDTALENMAEIPISVFEDIGDEDLYLRVWFDDGYYEFEQLAPDQRLSIVPYAVKTALTDATSMDLTGYVSLRADDLASNGGLAFEIAGSTNTLFSVDERGTASSRNIALAPLTSSSELSRLETGRIYYDGSANKFMGCNNSTCAEIGLAGSSGTADITAVTAGTGLIGGGTSGNATLYVDTSTVVTKTGNHIMAGSLTASSITAPTITSSTTINAAALTATGTVGANALTATTTTTTGGVAMPPTGTDPGDTAELQFLELAANGTHYVGFKAPDSALQNRIWVLPSAIGGDGQVLKRSGADVGGVVAALTWADDDDSGGDITGVTTSATSGLSGGAITGNVALSLAYSETLAGNPALGGGQVIFHLSDNGGGLLFEEYDADTVEGLLTVADLSVDRTWTLPDVTGTILLNADCTSIAAGEFNPTEAGATDDYLNLVDNSFSATEAAEDMFMVPIAMTARNLRAEVDVAPGAGDDQWTITLRDDAGSTTLTCTIDEANTSCTDTTNAPSIAAGSKLDILVGSNAEGAPADPAAAAALTVSFCLGP